ncbi:MAG: shikimate kinase [Holosporales bacterium]|jgi:shikimate kinase|nr:shikimate kinase [Holosporales bacterium]
MLDDKDLKKQIENTEPASRPQQPMPSRPTTPIVSFVPPKSVVLVGLMGCGKTSIGKRLAKRFDLPFCDSDQEVEAAAGCSIGEIENVFGEGALASGEQKVISRLLESGVQIIATGCLSFSYESTRELIKEKAISVWLKADLPTLLTRVTGRKDRPLLAPGREEEILKDLIVSQYPLFEKANVHVQTYDEPTNITVDRVIIALSDFIRGNFPDYHVLKSV